jgi:hypothetical protein
MTLSVALCWWASHNGVCALSKLSIGRMQHEVAGAVRAPSECYTTITNPSNVGLHVVATIKWA